jgi:hypothetical protein
MISLLFVSDRKSGRFNLFVNHIDYNGAEGLIASSYAKEWEELLNVLIEMPLHVKASDQAGIQGSLIFDPVGTNEHIKREMIKLGWRANIPIPDKYNFLGTDVDFLKSSFLVEVQFSNYPFLLNNTVRSELFFKARTRLGNSTVDVVVIITKAHMLPASNSTLYYEQAQNQLTELANHNVFDVPMRLVGLFESAGETINAVVTEYASSRYSRTVAHREQKQCFIVCPRTARGRCSLRLV